MSGPTGNDGSVNRVNLGPEYHFLVHDCYASSEGNNVQILDENGLVLISYNTQNWQKTL